MIVVDSSVWIDYFNGQMNAATDLLDDLLGDEPILIGDLIYAEVLQGFQEDRDYIQAKKLFESLTFGEMLGKDVALRSVDNYRTLRKKSVTIRKTIDMIIGTFCIETNMSLLHQDRDFDPMEKHLKLRVVR
jgi:predicted nucleic acid-binding protein